MFSLSLSAMDFFEEDDLDEFEELDDEPDELELEDELLELLELDDEEPVLGVGDLFLDVDFVLLLERLVGFEPPRSEELETA